MMTEKPTYEALEKRVQELEQAEFERNKAMVLLRESEARHRKKLENTLLPEGEAGALGLSDIMDTMSIQSMMDDFFKLTNIGVAILDLHGKILVATGWSEQEAVGKPLETVFRIINDGSRETVESPVKKVLIRIQGKNIPYQG